MTPAEVAVWRYVRADQLGVKFRRQHPIGPYIADFVCVSLKIIIELDGAPHDESQSDQRRDAYLRHLGFRILRFENDVVGAHMSETLATISQAIAERTP